MTFAELVGTCVVAVLANSLFSTMEKAVMKLTSVIALKTTQSKAKDRMNQAVDFGHLMMGVQKMANETNNADRIRALDDVELAKLLFGFCDNSERCYFCPLYETDCGGQTSVEDWVDWLRKPMGEDND